MSKNNPTTKMGASETESFVELSEGFLVGGGRYSLSQSLGQGGMGTVWLAKDERLGQMVALKFVQLQSNPLILDDLRRETARSLKLTHPNIIRIYDFYEAPGEVAFISMEFVDGANLHSLRAEQPHQVFSWNYLKPIIKQLCEALEYAHGEEVIHRDLKPSNMMLDGKGRLKLADFGIAAAMSDPLQVYYQRHAASGTITHMSPQQMVGKPAAIADDIYALGATLYDLLTGTTPFNTGDIPEQVQNSLAEPIAVRLAKLNLPNEVPPHVAAMIMACLSKEPEPRPQTARAVSEWIGFNSPTLLRTTPILVSTTNAKPVAEHKTKTITLPISPAPAKVVEHVPEQTQRIPPIPPTPQLPRLPQFPLNKYLAWAGIGMGAFIIFGALGWLIGAKMFQTESMTSTLPDGSAALDSSFQTKTVIDNFVGAISTQSDGKILIGGGFENIGGVESKRIARLNADGTLDKSFVASVNSALHCVATQKDGKIIIAGDFTDVSGQACKSIARLTVDGTLDTNFKLTMEPGGTIHSLVIQPDGKIIVTGNFTDFEAAKLNRIARLNADGTVDEKFLANVNGVVWQAALTANEKIVIGGTFVGVEGSKQGRIARLHSDGRLDRNFNSGSGANGAIYAITIQKDGNIIIGGEFTEFNSRPRNRIARLNADGSLDATFNPGAGPDSGIRAVLIQPDQKILLGGTFQFFNDTALGHIARLNVNGSLDSSFDPGTGFNGVVRALNVQDDGKILVAGNFTNYNGVASTHIVRLKGMSVDAKK